MKNSGPAIVVTGASGFIGRALVERLAAQNARVSVVTRTPDPWPSGVTVIETPDLSSDETPDDLFAGADIVIHLAAAVSPLKTASETEASETVRIAEVVGKRLSGASVPRTIVLSSVAAKISEETPDQGRPYGFEKSRADAVIAGHLGPEQKAVFLRPPAIYGPGMKGSLAFLASLLKKGIPLPFGTASAPRDYLFRDNLTDLVISITEADEAAWQQAAGQSFSPCDGQPVGTADLIRNIGIAIGKKPVQIPMPAAVIRMLATVAGKAELARSIFDPLSANDNAAIAGLFGWMPAKKMPESLDFLSAPPRNSG